MDTSKTYIKMCEKAVKIQKEWKPQLCDWAYDEVEQMNYPITLVMFIKVWPEYYKNHVWLPRQDQLQAMVFSVSPPTALDIFHLLAFMQFAHSAMDEVDSMEQLWLAFVMKEKYNKTWDGEEWVDND